MAVKYTFLVNVQKDISGRRTALFDGYTPGDQLALAYEGEIEDAVYGRFPETRHWAITEGLFTKFNISHPADYRGPSMSIGDVVTFEDKAFSCQRLGFEAIAMPTHDQIVEAPTEWKGQPVVS